MKKISCLLAVFCLVLGILPPASADTKDVIVIETVTLGTEYTDIPAVEEAVNQIVFPLLNAKIKLLNVDIRRHESQINRMIANGEQIDLVMAGLTLPMMRMALEGKLLPLDDLVAAFGEHLLSFFGEQLDAGRVNGKLYAIPADAYTAKSGGFIYNREMADNLGIHMPNPVTYDQLEQIFSILHQKLPGVYGTVFGNGETFNAQYDICLEEYGNALFAYGVTFDPFQSTKIENLFESPAFMEYIRRHRDWVEKGYAPGHSLTSGIRSNEYMAHQQVFGMTTNYSPIEGPVQQGNYPFSIGIVQITSAVNSTSSLQERMWAVPVTSKSPDKAIAFLDLLFSNAQVANLLSNGIEGLHYRQVAPGVITNVENADQSAPGYASVFSRFGDQMQVQHWLPATPDFYDELSAFNDQAQNSLSLGYVFNGESVSSEIAAVNSVVSLYLPALECGMLPDVDAALATLNREVKNAGIDRIIEENQRQLDAWLQEKGQNETAINSGE